MSSTNKTRLPVIVIFSHKILNNIVYLLSLFVFISVLSFLTKRNIDSAKVFLYFYTVTLDEIQLYLLTIWF